MPSCIVQPVHQVRAQHPQGPLFGGKVTDSTDAAFAPKLYHIVVALGHYKVRLCLPLGIPLRAT